jgi:hypothetical protein
MEFQSPPKETFADVTFSPRANSGSHFYLEHASPGSLLLALGMLSLFLLMHLGGALRAPPLLSSTDEFYTVNNINRNASIDVAFTLTHLEASHRYVALNGSLVPKDKSTGFMRLVTVAVRLKRLEPYSVNETNEPDGRTSTMVVFVPGNNESSAFNVLHTGMYESGTLEITATITMNFSGIVGLLFHWEFQNPSAEKYDRSSKLLVSFLIGYTLVVFVRDLRLDTESFTQVFLVVVGIAGVLASNPLSYFMAPAKGARISDHVLMSAFEGVFRMFLVSQMELLRRHSTTPSRLFLVVVGVFFGVYAIAQAVAAYDRQSHLAQAERAIVIVLKAEMVVMGFDIAFSIGSLIYLVVAAIGNDGMNTRRTVLVGVSLIGIIVATLVSDVFFVLTGKKMYTPAPSLLLSSTHVTFAALALFLLHTDSGRKYDAIVEQANAPVAVMELDSASDGGVDVKDI